MEPLEGRIEALGRERPPLEVISFRPGSVVVTIAVDVRNAAGDKIDERTGPPISLNYPHGEKLEQVLAVVVASVAEQYEADRSG